MPLQAGLNTSGARTALNQFAVFYLLSLQACSHNRLDMNNVHYPYIIRKKACAVKILKINPYSENLTKILGNSEIFTKITTLFSDTRRRKFLIPLRFPVPAKKDFLYHLQQQQKAPKPHSSCIILKNIKYVHNVSLIIILRFFEACFNFSPTEQTHSRHGGSKCLCRQIAKLIF